ncbi:hypothetical protein AWH56_005395 [Anaerobacillus isosaccharinicus]|uniref:Fur-regulated basic protein FbpA n=1 Tax=Anaerobacillus isosaccharinicus TaxID=1532552 RepID=A0A7S7L9Z3_9BACI|nr:Fur-regulated basic protein FbpA [Anaerobacillus isosaccharinicus]MBA5584540.1 Fur-regulated basic protein FbpA [Anaerobacillus isosaccharinicus]QOY37077.1 Fur-regulated basic protein FbpA [Anaerobacillus isosaccharinicus]
MSQANRLRQAVEAKRKELIELFENMGHTQIPCGTPIKSLTLTELQEIYKHGIKK